MWLGVEEAATAPTTQKRSSPALEDAIATRSVTSHRKSEQSYGKAHPVESEHKEKGRIGECITALTLIVFLGQHREKKTVHSGKKGEGDESQNQKGTNKFADPDALLDKRPVAAHDRRSAFPRDLRPLKVMCGVATAKSSLNKLFVWFRKRIGRPK